MNIEPIKENDLYRINKLAIKTWFDTYKTILKEEQLIYMFDMMYNIKNLEHNMRNGSSFYIIYDREDLGFVETTIKEKVIRLNKIYVTPNQQGKGIGKDLIKFVCNIAKNKRKQHIELNVNRYNKAVKFYLKEGFQIIKKEDNSIGKGFIMEDYMMRRKIT